MTTKSHQVCLFFSLSNAVRFPHVSVVSFLAGGASGSGGVTGVVPMGGNTPPAGKKGCC